MKVSTGQLGDVDLVKIFVVCVTPQGHSGLSSSKSNIAAAKWLEAVSNLYATRMEAVVILFVSNLSASPTFCGCSTSFCVHCCLALQHNAGLQYLQLDILLLKDIRLLILYSKFKLR